MRTSIARPGFLALILLTTLKVSGETRAFIRTRFPELVLLAVSAICIHFTRAGDSSARVWG